jgi:hypothetical protein
MPPNPLARHAPWRQIVLLAVSLPVVIGLAVLAFLWPAARTAPRDLPIGVAGSGPIVSAAGAGLAQHGFAVTSYPDRSAADAAIRDRDVYGAVLPGAGGTTVLVASAASPGVAAVLADVAAAAPGPVHVDDVVPLAPGDPRGTVLASAVLPLVLGSEIVAVAVAVLVGMRPARRQIVALAVAAATTALAAYAIEQWWLGALPGGGPATWAVLALAVFAIAATTAGMYELLGAAGIGLTAATMIFLGNAFSGATSAPELLPPPAGEIGRWLPPGAAANLLRSAAYFSGHGGAQPVAALAAWSAFGMVAIVVGHRRRPAVPAAGRHALEISAANADELASAAG